MCCARIYKDPCLSLSGKQTHGTGTQLHLPWGLQTRIITKQNVYNQNIHPMHSRTLNIQFFRVRMVKHGHRLLRVMVAAPSPEMFKARLGGFGAAWSGEGVPVHSRMKRRGFKHPFQPKIL